MYRAGPPEALRAVPLDSLTAIFHRTSGQTHVVAEPIPQILAALTIDACTIATLIERLGLPDTDDTRALLAARLDEIVIAGLATRA